MKRFIALLLVLICIGCGSYQLEPKWAPLKSIVEVSQLPVGDHTVVTVSPYLLTKDLDLFLEIRPPGSVNFTALMLHEQTHAVRQETYPEGKAKWLYKYTTDPSFRWEEEKAGFYKEIQYQLGNNKVVYVENLAHALSNNYHRMVSYDNAKSWIKSVISEYHKIQNGVNGTSQQEE